MADFIKRSDALNVIETANSMVYGLLEATTKLCVTMNSIAAADVVPVRHGRWINGHCTRCGEDVASRLDIWTNIQRFLYCPFCGVRMDGDGE